MRTVTVNPPPPLPEICLRCEVLKLEHYDHLKYRPIIFLVERNPQIAANHKAFNKRYTRLKNVMAVQGDQSTTL